MGETLANMLMTKFGDGVVAMSAVLGGIAIILGMAGVAAFSPWLASGIVLGMVLEGTVIVARHRRANARRYGSQVAALRHIHDIRVLGNEYSGHHAA
jgi:hypothetical protein